MGNFRSQTFKDPEVVKFLRDRGMPLPPDDYGIVQCTWENYRTALHKSDKHEVYDVELTLAEESFTFFVCNV